MDYLVEFDNLPWQSPVKGIRFKAVTHGSRRLRLVEYTRDMDPHWCEKGHIGYLLEGRFEISFDKGSFKFNPGDGIFIPPGREHRHMGKALSGVARALFVEDVED
jgi:ethanolamine utilization protein EutQ (cupin superfamily)